MIDIRSAPAPAQASPGRVPVLLFAILAFVVWDSGYMQKWIPSQERENDRLTAASVLLIKSSSMSTEQQYTASSPVLDEVADQRGIDFRVIDESPGELKDAPGWIKELFLRHEGESPCLVVADANGKQQVFPAPSSVSEFRSRIGAK